MARTVGVDVGFGVRVVVANVPVDIGKEIAGFAVVGEEFSAVFRDNADEFVGLGDA